jgi:hypothetical protein
MDSTSGKVYVATNQHTLGGIVMGLTMFLIRGNKILWSLRVALALWVIYGYYAAYNGWMSTDILGWYTSLGMLAILVEVSKEFMWYTTKAKNEISRLSVRPVDVSQAL